MLQGNEGMRRAGVPVPPSQGSAELRPPAGRGGGRAGPGRGDSPAAAAAARSGGAMESGGALNGSAAAAATGRFAAAGTVALAALMALLIAVTVAGNALVMLAFVADSSLRTQNNFFLLNLAISDFLVGKVPSPLGSAPAPPLPGPAATSRRAEAPAPPPAALPPASLPSASLSASCLAALRFPHGYLGSAPPTFRSCPSRFPAPPGSGGARLLPSRGPELPSRHLPAAPFRRGAGKGLSPAPEALPPGRPPCSLRVRRWKRTPLVAGAFCIPLYVPYVLTGRWIFGRSLCKLWLVVDYLLCTSSVFNIVLISYDRFLSVTRAVSPVVTAERGTTLLVLYSPNSLQ